MSTEIKKATYGTLGSEKVEIVNIKTGDILLRHSIDARELIETGQYRYRTMAAAAPGMAVTAKKGENTAQQTPGEAKSPETAEIASGEVGEDEAQTLEDLGSGLPTDPDAEYFIKPQGKPLTDLKINELRAMGKKAGITGYNTMKKPDLVRLLMSG